MKRLNKEIVMKLCLLSDYYFTIFDIFDIFDIFHIESQYKNLLTWFYFIFIFSSPVTTTP